MKIRQRILNISLIAFLMATSLLVGVVQAQAVEVPAGTGTQIEVLPPNPGPEDSITLVLSGTWPNSCVPQSPQVGTVNNQIWIHTSNPGEVCATILMSWELEVSIGKLSEGTYTVVVTYTGSGGGSQNIGEKFFTVKNQDTTSPNPDPMVWATAPRSTGPNTIEMKAASATDPEENGVEYKFKETTGHSGGSDSDWQSSRFYTDSELEPDIQYCYQVKARDKSPNQNETEWATTKCGTTETDNSPPTASFTASPSSGAVPLEVSFDASDSHDPDGTVEDYSWDFDDGSAGTGETVTHTYDNADNYNVELTVTDNDGAMDSAIKTVEVTATPNNITVRSSDLSLQPGESGETVVNVDSLPDGLAGYIVTLNIQDTSVGHFTCSGGDQKGVTFLNPDSAGNVDNCLSASITFRDADLGDDVEPGASNVNLAKVKVQADQNAQGGDSTPIQVQVDRLEEEDGDVVSPTTENGNLTIGQQLTTTLLSGWNLFSPPGIPQNPDPGTALGDDIDSLQLYYDYSNGNYTNYPNTSTQLTSKQGYWVQVSEDTPVDMAVDVPTQDYTLEFISEGWKMVGVPYEADWKDTGFSDPSDFQTDGAGNVRLVSWDPTNEQYLNHYSGDSYVLGKWRGFWVKVKEASSPDPARLTVTKSLEAPPPPSTQTPLPQSVDRDELDYPPLPQKIADNFQAFAYPNPVMQKDQVTFTARMANVKEIKVTVANSAGEVVYSSGYKLGNKLTWDLRNASSNKVANGILLYKIQAKRTDGTTQASEVKQLLVLQ